MKFDRPSLNKSFIFFASTLTLASNVWAQGAPAAPQVDAGKSLLMQLPIILAILAFFYFAMIRPQQQQQKKHKEFLAGLSKGEEVVTASGIIGIITGLTDRVVTLDVSQGPEIKFLRSQVQYKLKDILAAANNGQ